MKNSIKWLVSVVLLIAVLSCKKNSSTEPPAPVADKTLPTISIVDPVAGKSIVLGTPVHLQMDLADNIELKSYKVVISKSLKGIVTSDWAFSTGAITIAAGKKTYSVNQDLTTVPLTVTGNQTTTGNYDLTITCLDTSGNEATKTLTIALTK